MGTFKGTKGEWKISKEPFSLLIVGEKENGLPIGIASVTGNSKQEANAKLIAAAPELLEALTNLKDEVVRECDLGSDKSLLPMLGYVQDAILAIKKATE